MVMELTGQDTLCKHRVVRDKIPVKWTMQRGPILPSQQLATFMEKGCCPAVLHIPHLQRIFVIQMMHKGWEHNVGFGFIPKENLSPNSSASSRICISVMASRSRLIWRRRSRGLHSR